MNNRNMHWTTNILDSNYISDIFELKEEMIQLNIPCFNPREKCLPKERKELFCTTELINSTCSAWFRHQSSSIFLESVSQYAEENIGWLLEELFQEVSWNSESIKAVIISLGEFFLFILWGIVHYLEYFK